MARGGRLAWLGLVVLLLAPSSSRGESAPTDALLTLGIRQYREGDLEAALFSLDTATRRSREQDRRDLLAKAEFYLGAVYVSLGQDEVAKQHFQAVLQLDSKFQPNREDLPRKVLRAWEAAGLEQSARRKSPLALIAGGIGVAGSGAALLALTRNQPPTVTISVSPPGRMIMAVTRVHLLASATDPDGDALTYEWDLGDGTRASGAEVSHLYEQEGNYTATVTASDKRGATATATAPKIEVLSMSGQWEAEIGCNRCLTRWIQRGTSLHLEMIHPGPTGSGLSWAQNRTWLGGRLSDPREITLDLRELDWIATFTGPASSLLDEVYVTGAPAPVPGERVYRFRWRGR